MIRVRVRLASGLIQSDPTLEELHMLSESPDTLLWLDLDSPTPDEVALIAGLFGWSHLTVEDVTKQGQRGKLEHFGPYYFLVMHDLVYDAQARRLATPEVDFIIGANYVASIHYHHLAHVAEAHDLEASVEIILSKGPDYLLYYLTDRLVDGYMPSLDDMHEAVEDLEQAIITDPTENLLPRIFEMKRDAIALRKVISPQLDVFSRLTSPGLGIVLEEHTMLFRDVHDHLIRIFEAMDTYRELMSGALDAYLSNVSNRMNDVMKRLTILSALFLPITFITGLFGMNLRQSPPWDDSLFWVFLAAMLFICIFQWFFFRAKRWV